MLRRLGKFNFGSQKFNVKDILSGKTTPKLQMFVNGKWMESAGEYESTPYALNKNISISHSPTLNLQSERDLIKESMQTVILLEIFK